jgi:hypothetical protein
MTIVTLQAHTKAVKHWLGLYHAMRSYELTDGALLDDSHELEVLVNERTVIRTDRVEPLWYDDALLIMLQLERTKHIGAILAPQGDRWLPWGTPSVCTKHEVDNYENISTKAALLKRLMPVS